MRVERRAFGIGDAGIRAQGGILGAPRHVDLQLRRQALHIGAVQPQIAGDGPSSPGSGRPACGSSVVISASSIAERTMWRMPSADRSEV